MKKTITPKPSYIASLLFMIPIVGYALIQGILFLAHPNSDGGGIHPGIIATGLAFLAFGGFMGFLLVKGLMYVMNFSLGFDEKNVELNTYLGERHSFHWEDIVDIIHYDTGEKEILLKSGKSVKFKSRMLEMGEFFREYSKKQER